MQTSTLAKLTGLFLWSTPEQAALAEHAALLEQQDLPIRLSSSTEPCETNLLTLFLVEATRNKFKSRQGGGGWGCWAYTNMSYFRMQISDLSCPLPLCGLCGSGCWPHGSGGNGGSDEPSGSGGGPHVSGGSLGLFMCLQVARLTNSLP